MNKKIDIPVELYARLQELSHLARYEYTEQEGTWTIQNPEGESLLDARRKISRRLRSFISPSCRFLPQNLLPKTRRW